MPAVWQVGKKLGSKGTYHHKIHVYFIPRYSFFRNLQMYGQLKKDNLTNIKFDFGKIFSIALLHLILYCQNPNPV